MLLRFLGFQILRWDIAFWLDENHGSWLATSMACFLFHTWHILSFKCSRVVSFGLAQMSSQPSNSILLKKTFRVSFGGGGRRCRCPMIKKVGIAILEVRAKLRECLKAGWKGDELFEVSSSYLTSTYLFNDFELCPNVFVTHKSVMFFSISFKIWMQLANAKFILLCNEQTKKQSYALNVTNDSPVSLSKNGS
jgi:hypothetical protein